MHAQPGCRRDTSGDVTVDETATTTATFTTSSHNNYTAYAASPASGESSSAKTLYGSGQHPPQPPQPPQLQPLQAQQPHSGLMAAARSGERRAGVTAGGLAGPPPGDEDGGITAQLRRLFGRVGLSSQPPAVVGATAAAPPQPPPGSAGGSAASTSPAAPAATAAPAPASAAAMPAGTAAPAPTMPAGTAEAAAPTVSTSSPATQGAAAAVASLPPPAGGRWFPAAAGAAVAAGGGGAGGGVSRGRDGFLYRLAPQPTPMLHALTPVAEDASTGSVEQPFPQLGGEYQDANSLGGQGGAATSISCRTNAGVPVRVEYARALSAITALQQSVEEGLRLPLPPGEAAAAAAAPGVAATAEVVAAADSQPQLQLPARPGCAKGAGMLTSVFAREAVGETAAAAPDGSGSGSCSGSAATRTLYFPISGLIPASAQQVRGAAVWRPQAARSLGVGVHSSSGSGSSGGLLAAGGAVAGGGSCSAGLASADLHSPMLLGLPFAYAYSNHSPHAGGPVGVLTTYGAVGAARAATGSGAADESTFSALQQLPQMMVGSQAGGGGGGGGPSLQHVSGSLDTCECEFGGKAQVKERKD